MKGSEIAGDILGGLGPGLLSGVGKALSGDPDPSKIPGTTPDAGNKPQAPKAGAPGTAHPNSFKKGGVVQKTGVALVHKGERVIPADEGDKPVQNVSLHRALADLHKGGLHRALHVPEGQPIPKDKLATARNSDNPHIQHMANFAHTLEGFHKK